MKKTVSAVSIPLASLNRGDFKIKALIFLVAFIGFSCTDHENPLALISLPVGKATVDSDSDECLAISWSCDTEVDSVWTVFYGADYRFQAHGERVLFSHYLDSNSKTQYWASETSTRFGRVRSGFRSGDGTCGIWSEAIDHDSSAVRIYKGDVGYLYRDTPNAIYALSESDVQYSIAFVQAEGSVRHRDFLSVHNRNDPRPAAGLVEIGDNPTRAYYLPVNFSTAALDTLTNIPQDDRPYLDDSICSGDECPEWTEPICPSDEEEDVVVRSESQTSESQTSESQTSESQTSESQTSESQTSESQTSESQTSESQTSESQQTVFVPEEIESQESQSTPEPEPEIVCSVTNEQIRAVTRFYSFRFINGKYRGASVEFNDYADDCWFPHSCDDGQTGGCVRLDRDPQPGPNSNAAPYVYMWNCFDCQ